MRGISLTDIVVDVSESVVGKTVNQRLVSEAESLSVLDDGGKQIYKFIIL